MIEKARTLSSIGEPVVFLLRAVTGGGGGHSHHLLFELQKEFGLRRDSRSTRDLREDLERKRISSDEFDNITLQNSLSSMGNNTPVQVMTGGQLREFVEAKLNEAHIFVDEASPDDLSRIIGDIESGSRSLTKCLWIARSPNYGEINADGRLLTKCFRSQPNIVRYNNFSADGSPFDDGPDRNYPTVITVVFERCCRDKATVEAALLCKERVSSALWAVANTFGGNYRLIVATDKLRKEYSGGLHRDEPMDLATIAENIERGKRAILETHEMSIAGFEAQAVLAIGSTDGAERGQACSRATTSLAHATNWRNLVVNKYSVHDAHWVHSNECPPLKLSREEFLKLRGFWSEEICARSDRTLTDEEFAEWTEIKREVLGGHGISLQYPCSYRVCHCSPSTLPVRPDLYAVAAPFTIGPPGLSLYLAAPLTIGPGESVCVRTNIRICGGDE